MILSLSTRSGSTYSPHQSPVWLHSPPPSGGGLLVSVVLGELGISRDDSGLPAEPSAGVVIEGRQPIPSPFGEEARGRGRVFPRTPKVSEYAPAKFRQRHHGKTIHLYNRAVANISATALSIDRMRNSRQSSEEQATTLLELRQLDDAMRYLRTIDVEPTLYINRTWAGMPNNLL